MSNDTEQLDWWIATGFFDKGGEKVMGPFVSRDLAMQVRTLRETIEGHAAYFIDSEPAPTTTPTHERPAAGKSDGASRLARSRP